jgi:hypothetical protein
MRMRKGKEKRGNGLKFNPTDYDYMDSLPMEGWIWEFIKRSTKYKDFNQKCEQNLKKGWQAGKDSALFKEYIDNFFPFFSWSSEDRSLLVRNVITKLNPIRIVNLEGIGFSKIGECGIPHPLIKKEKKKSSKVYYILDYPLIQGDSLDGDYHYERDHPIELLFRNQGRKNILMVLIDLSTPGSVDELLKKLSIELLGWRKALRLPETRSPKTDRQKKNILVKKAKIWKSYLMVYDLIAAGCSINEASDMLSECDEFYSGPKNIENHFKRATALINGGYKKFV